MFLEVDNFFDASSYMPYTTMERPRLRGSCRLVCESEDLLKMAELIGALVARSGYFVGGAALIASKNAALVQHYIHPSATYKHREQSLQFLEQIKLRELAMVDLHQRSVYIVDTAMLESKHSDLLKQVLNSCNESGSLLVLVGEGFRSVDESSIQNLILEPYMSLETYERCLKVFDLERFADSTTLTSDLDKIENLDAVAIFVRLHAPFILVANSDLDDVGNPDYDDSHIYNAREPHMFYARKKFTDHNVRSRMQMPIIFT